MSFTTVAEVALYLNRDVADLLPLEVTQIETLIRHIDGLINNYCGWNMLTTAYTDKRYDGTGTNTLDLRLSPVNSITAVKVRASDGTFTDVTAGIEILDSGEIQFLPWATTAVTTFTAGVKNWFITFNAGYAEEIPAVPAVVGPPAVAEIPAVPSTIPPELSYAAAMSVSTHFNKLIDENTGIEEEKFGEATFKSATLELSPAVKRDLDRYRLVSIF